MAGMKLIAELPHKKHSSAIFCQMEIQPTKILKVNEDDIELLTIETNQVAITFIYKPHAVRFKLTIKQTDKADILIGGTLTVTIPRGCRKEYKPGLIEESMDLYKQYNVAFDKSPFSQITTELGEELVNNISEHRRET